MWILGDVKFGEHSIKLSGAGNYIETNTTTAPTNPASGKIRLYATGGTSLKMKDSAGTETDLAAAAGGGDLYNFLTNPGFEVWQRGAGAFTANSAYTADRWWINLGASSTISVTRESTTKRDDSKYSLKGVYTHSANSHILSGAFEDGDGSAIVYQLRGRQVTFALYVHANAANAVRLRLHDGSTATYSSYHTGGSTWELLTVTVTLPSTGLTNMNVGVELNATVTFFLDNATLVIGSTAQTYYPLHSAEEWERCQRYYEVHGGVANVFPEVDTLGAASTVTAITISYMTRKAVSATVTKNGTWSTSNSDQPTGSGLGVQGYKIYVTATAAGRVLTRPDTTDDTITAEANP